VLWKIGVEMQYRRLGRTNLRASVIGFGTCQLRLVPEQQAIDTLRRGFELGVNIVHVAPDYEGADDLVAQALRETSKDVIICSQGYGTPELFEHLFETTCRTFDKERLELFGIACIDDREILGENVWGTGGMVEFLLRKKEEGRVGGIFCTTHGTPEYIKKLIESDLFDALMIPYNPLGFHLLTASLPGKDPENLHGNKDIVFPAARKNDVGIMIMKPLGGGLLCPGRAFPQLNQLIPESNRISAGKVLRYILMNEEVSCVVPGTASIEEAEENAQSGFGYITLKEGDIRHIENQARSLAVDTCSRCGRCEALCSQNLPISWLFRAAYIANYPSETFETPGTHDYFRLHPDEESICGNCQNITCACINGIDIPVTLARIHTLMKKLRSKGMVPLAEVWEISGLKEGYRAKVITKELPPEIRCGRTGVCRLYLENSGRLPWHANANRHQPKIVLCVSIDGAVRQTVHLRHDVNPLERTHFVFELSAPPDLATMKFSLFLAASSRRDKYTCVLPLGEQEIVIRKNA
jgi:predicted aldo/keto reductase-like oxidoreductase